MCVPSTSHKVERKKMLLETPASFQLVLIFALAFWKSSCFEYESPEYACGELLEAGRGVIESPFFPDLYPPQVDCSWQVLAPAGYTIRLTSEYFSLEHQEKCLWDYLAIEDGEAGEFGHAVYCGSEGFNFLSESNIVQLHFHTDVTGSDSGFRIRYEGLSNSSEETTCNVTLKEDGVVTSPGYPHRYPAESECYYRFQGLFEQHVSLEFIEFHVETAPCDFDKLEVYDGDLVEPENLLGIFCGSDLPVTLISETSNMTLRFVSDARLQSRGFKAVVRFLPREGLSTAPVPASPSVNASTLVPVVTETPSSPTQSEVTGQSLSLSTTGTSVGFSHAGCNMTITATKSNISSPGFPQRYPHSMVCITKLRSDVNSTFLITFVSFSVEEEEECSYDSLSIYKSPQTANSSDSGQVLLRRLCGDRLDNPILSFEGHGLDLVFRSDTSTSEAGYFAHVLIAPLVHGPSCPAVCENGGSCSETVLADGAIDWICICPERFTGTLCEQEVREMCADINCLNGVCRDDGVTASCVCSNGYTGKFCEQFNTISEGGSLYFTKMVGNMSVSVGSSVILECAVNDPTAHVMWLFQDLIITNTDWSRGVEVHPGGVVVIPEVEEKHSGRYTCMAVTSNDLVERSMWIQLTEPCSLYVTKSPSNITVREGQTAMFQCYVPDADVILWRKDGDIVSQGPRKRILVNNYLVINSVIETDTGKYTCAARSKNGCFARLSAYLTVDTMGHGKGCGRPRNKPQVTSTGRISSGREALLGSAPWHVILRESRKDTTFCGGSLISPDTVLTAAHCVSQFESIFGYPFHPRYIQLYLGTHHCVGHNGIFRQIKSYILHEHFNDTHYNNDVAVFKLDSPVVYSDEIMPICLETPEFIGELLKPGHVGVITGCGGQYANGPVPTYLHEVQIPYVSREICRERAAAVRTNFTEGMFCAGYARSMRGDACSGDSGGPYIIEFSGRYVQAGIVSWGVGCDRENHYGYYTNIAHYYDWIMSKLS